MSAVTADPMATDDFATLLIESAAATPTPEEEPARDEARPEGEAPPTAEPDGDQPEGEQPAADEAKPEAEPQADAPKPEEKPQWQIDLEAAQAEREKLARENATLRGQIPNAKRQAEEAAYQRVQQEFRQNQRQELINSLQSMVNAGETTLEAANQQVAQFDAKQAAAAAQAQEQQFYAREVDNLHGGVALHMDHATVQLQQKGIESFAQQSGLPIEYARQYFDQPAIERYQRAFGQSEMAKRAEEYIAQRTGRRDVSLGFNAKADEDHIHTVYQGFLLAGQIHKTLTAQMAEAVAAKDAEIAELTKQLNRADAPDAPPEQPARGAGRRPRNPDERATQILTENSDALLAAFRG